MKFDEIFDEYYSMFRGQVVTLTGTDPEYTLGIRLANNGIKKWDRADGTLWRELIQTLQGQAVTDPVTVKTLTAGTILYPAPINMRKPPSKVRFYNGNGYEDVRVIEPQTQQDYSDLSNYVWFEGSANVGYIMHTSLQYAALKTGWSFDYVYIKKPTLIAISGDPGDTLVDMSDPNFLIQDMLASRFQNTRNGFGYKTAKADAQTALANMKVENNSGTWGTYEDWFNGNGWGTPSNGSSGIEL